MLKYYNIKNNILSSCSEREIEDSPTGPIWIDIFDPTLSEEKLIEQYLKINITTKDEITPLVLSSHHYKNQGGLYVTATIIAADKEMQNVTFIFTEGKIITLRYATFHSFERFLSYIKSNCDDTFTNISMFTSLMEAVINELGDSLEEIGRSIINISSSIFSAKNNSRKSHKKKKLNFNKLIDQIGDNGDLIARNHESLISIYCALIYILETKQFSPIHKDIEKIHNLIDDISPLKDRASFLSQKLDFLLDVCLGKISIEQNRIIKIVSIAALIFFPPTIIATVYGMNFDVMPELHWHWGYPFALLLIILSAILPYVYFKYKDWI